MAGQRALGTSETRLLVTRGRTEEACDLRIERRTVSQEWWWTGLESTAHDSLRRFSSHLRHCVCMGTCRCILNETESGHALLFTG